MRTRPELSTLLEDIKEYNLEAGSYHLNGKTNPFDTRLRTLLKDLQNNNVEENALYTAIHIFGESKFKEAQPYIESMLNSEDSELRRISLNVLGIHWLSKEHSSVYETVLLDKNDDVDNRGTAAICLGAAFRGSKNKKILNTLFLIFEHTDEHPMVRDSSYMAILYVWGVHPKKWPSSAKMLNYEKDIDWNLVTEIKTFLSNY